ncbi:MAG: hypothetical protein WCS85_04865 [Candidatus Peribacteraceae bacterium]|jgi:hypothetical protein
MNGNTSDSGPFTTIAHLLFEAKGPAEGDDSMDLVLNEQKRDVRTELEQALATLRNAGVPPLKVEHIGPSAILKVRHASHYQICLIISALNRIGEVTIRFPESEHP